MNNKVLLNIPHSSTYIPEIMKERIIVSEKELKEDIKLLTDYYVDELVDLNNRLYVKSEFSRLFFDAERYRNDDLEEMSKIGMGAIYTKTSKDKRLIKIDNNYREFVLSNYYDKYHEELNKKVGNIIKSNNNVLIVDLHSFSEELVNVLKPQYSGKEYPDFCIGFEEKYIDRNIIQKISEIIRKYGYTVEYNFPYTGSIIPTNYTDNNKLQSVMVEINKKIYMNEENLQKKNSFYLVKKIINEILEKIDE